MNSIQHVDAALAGFLSNPESGVLAIKGEWGVGKTHLWQKFSEAQPRSRFYSGYTYSSLFGQPTIADLRRSLFNKHRPFGDSKLVSDARVRKIATALTRHAGMVLKNTELAAGVFEDKALRNIVVCLDDLERKEKSLSSSALLGFITELRDERHCKVVLLYNERKAGGVKQLSAAIAEYREKVIDFEVTLAPTPSDCFGIIFAHTKYAKLNLTPESPTADATGDARSVLQIFEAARVANIRIMRKTRQALDYLTPQLETKFPRQYTLFIRQVVKLCCLHYLHASSLPIEEFADQARWIQMFINHKKEGPANDVHRVMHKIVESYDYHPMQADQLVIDFLRSGFVDWKASDSILKQIEAEHETAEMDKHTHSIWSQVWDNFLKSQDEVVAAQRRLLRDRHERLSLNAVVQLVTFLREISPNHADEEILTKKIADYASKLQASDDHDLETSMLDPQIATRVRKLLNRPVTPKPFNEVMDMMTKPGGWSPKSARFLATYSREEFKQWLETEATDRLMSKLAEFRSRLMSDSEYAPPILAKLDWALRQMARRSKLNARRVYVGVKLEKRVRKRKDA